MNPPPKITVIIVHWNSGEFLEPCLGAVERQTLAPQQILVIDNASPDAATVGIEARHPAVRVIRLPNNMGFAAANNLGVRAAEGSEWMALLNPDAFPEPRWLGTLWQAAQDNPAYTFFGSRLLRATCPQESDGMGDTYHVSGLMWRQHHGQVVSQNALVAREIFAPCAAAALYRRDVFLAAGGFDEHYFCYGEDVDLAFRLRLLGYRCVYVPEAVVYHVGSGSTEAGSDFALYHGHRNLIWTYLKNMPTPLFWLYLPQHLVLNIATLLWFALRGRAGVIWRAKRDGLYALPRVWQQRRGIQATRRVGAWELRRLMAKGWWMLYRRD